MAMENTRFIFQFNHHLMEVFQLPRLIAGGVFVRLMLDVGQYGLMVVKDGYGGLIMWNLVVYNG